MIERMMAAAATVLVLLALRVLPFRLTLALCDAWPRSPGPPASSQALARRVDRWMARGRSLWGRTCLTRTLVLYTMLRQHGYAPRLHIGTDGSVRQFRAHAWVSLGDIAVGESAGSVRQFAELVVHGA